MMTKGNPMDLKECPNCGGPGKSTGIRYASYPGSDEYKCVICDRTFAISRESGKSLLQVCQEHMLNWISFNRANEPEKATEASTKAKEVYRHLGYNDQFICDKLEIQLASAWYKQYPSKELVW